MDSSGGRTNIGGKRDGSTMMAAAAIGAET